MRTMLILIDRWLGSTKISAMHPEEEGAYFRLLLHAASQPDCGLPDNDNELARFSRLGELWFKRPKLSNLTRGERVRQCFFEKDGRLYNELLLEDRKKWESIIDQKRTAGVVSGERRRQKSNSRSTGVQQPFNGCSTAVQRAFNSRSTATPTEREREANGDPNGNEPEAAAAAEAKAESETTTAAAVVQEPSESPPLDWVQAFLTQYVREGFGLNWPPADVTIAQQIQAACGEHSWEELQEFLQQLHEQGRRPTKSYAWFVPVIQGRFGGLANGKRA